VTGVISSLSAFQTYSGGFAPLQDGEPTLAATENALFLATVFGGQGQVLILSVFVFLGIS